MVNVSDKFRRIAQQMTLFHAQIYKSTHKLQHFTKKKLFFPHRKLSFRSTVRDFCHMTRCGSFIYNMNATDISLSPLQEKIPSFLESRIPFTDRQFLLGFGPTFLWVTHSFMGASAKGLGVDDRTNKRYQLNLWPPKRWGEMGHLELPRGMHTKEML